MTLISRLTAAFAVVLAVLAIFAPLPAEGQGSVESDRIALVALYDATGGDNWENNEGWKTDRPLSEWYGVTTAAGGRVTRLWLSENNLTGEIPGRELGGLTNLENLQIWGNNLTGEIPRELGRLTNLTRLGLSASNLTGEIPRELGGLTQLSHLSLGENNLTGEIPRELGNLTNLENLYLSYNNLTGEIPRELGRLTSLERLSLQLNNLSGEVPRELARFEDTINPQQNGVILPIEGDGTVDPVDSAADKAVLEAFFDATGGANWNNNEGWKTDRPLSEWYGVTTRIAAGVATVAGLSLPDNNLTGEIPPRLADLPNLETLVLNGNSLTGAIPEALRRFESTINPQQGGVNLPVGTPVPALPFVGALLLACGLYVMGRRRLARPH